MILKLFKFLEAVAADDLTEVMKKLYDAKVQKVLSPETYTHLLGLVRAKKLWKDTSTTTTTTKTTTTTIPVRNILLFFVLTEPKIAKFTILLQNH